MSQKIKPTERSISEVLESMRTSFKNAYGRLLTEEEAVKLVDEIREDLKQRGEL